MRPSPVGSHPPTPAVSSAPKSGGDLVEVRADPRGMQRPPERKDFPQQGTGLRVGHHRGEPSLQVDQFGCGVLGQRGGQRAEGGARGAVARAAQPARTVNIERPEQGPQGDLLGVLMLIGPTALRTAAPLVQGLFGLGGDQHLLQGGEQLVGLGQVQADQVDTHGVVGLSFYCRSTLVDSSHEAQNYRLAPFRDYRPYYLRLAAWKLLRPRGLIRVAQDLGFRERPTGPVAAIAQTARQARADAQELLSHALTGPSATPPDLRDLRLLVITAGDRLPGGYEAAWRELQSELVALSTRGTQIFAEHAGHHIHRDDPDFMVQVLRDVIAELRAAASGQDSVRSQR